jgi:predicted membrane-bound spermidine synthase
MSIIATPASFVRHALFGVFVLSGATGLIYESIWSRYLSLFLGHAAYAQSFVLAIFMGGLALGSWLAARLGVRLRNLLLGYAALEAAIGALALLFHDLYGVATAFAFDTAIPALGSSAAAQLTKWVLATALLLPQALLLGMTFPFISAGVIRRFPENSGETLAMLYFSNSLGAVLGVLASGFVLLQKFGLPGTLVCAGILNLLLAVVVWALARGDTGPAPEPVATPATQPASRRELRWMLGVAALSGAAAFCYEIGWIRLLSLVLGSSTHSFELMLSAFILGLALGSLWIRRRLDHHPAPQRLLSMVMLATAAAALLTLVAYNRTFDLMAAFIAAFSATPGGFAGFNIASHGIAAAIMLPATFCAGMSLPLMTHILLRQGWGERAIGTVYAANTLGAIAGVLVAVHGLIPWVGVKGLILAGAALHMAVGIAVLQRSAQPLPARRAWLRALACALVLYVAATTVRFDPLRMTSAVYRTGVATRDADARVLYLRDGKTATISLLAQNGAVSLATNGKPDALIQMGDASASADESTMTLAATLPLLLHPEPRRVANIGIGSGLTSHVLLHSPRIAQLDSIEIEPLIFEAARLGFMPRVHQLFEDPRSRIVFEDARTFFSLQRTGYDVIVSEPSNPWVSGVASLFTDEFYGRLVRHLNPGGLLVQWLQIYETDLSIVASVMGALDPHFSDYALFHSDNANLLVVAKRDGQLPALASAALASAVFTEPALAAELRRIGVLGVQDIEKRRLGTKASLRGWFASLGAPRNSDFHPYVDLQAARARFMSRSASLLTQLNLLPVPVTQLLESGPHLQEATLVPTTSFIAFDSAAAQALQLTEAVLQLGRPDIPTGLARMALTANLDAAACEIPAMHAMWRAAMNDIAAATSAYLAPQQLLPLWRHLREHACYQRLDAAERGFAKLLEAVAARDRPAIIAAGLPLLQANSTAHSQPRLAYVLSATAASQIASGQRDAARTLLRQYFAAQVIDPQYEMMLRMLLAMVEERGASD